MVGNKGTSSILRRQSDDGISLVIYVVEIVALTFAIIGRVLRWNLKHALPRRELFRLLLWDQFLLLFHYKQLLIAKLARTVYKFL